MENNIIILNARKIKFKDEEKNQVVEGLSINYCDNLETHSENDFSGVEIFKAFMPINQSQNIKTVPGLYQGIFNYKSQAGKRVEQLVAINYLNGIIVEVS